MLLKNKNKFHLKAKTRFNSTKTKKEENILHKN